MSPETEKAFLIERIRGAGPADGYTQVWQCEPPDEGVGYRVLRQEWDDAMDVRTIYEIEVAE